MRATWSGMISFGLVNIPVKVYTAARDERISFHQMHREDSGRVGYQKVCKSCGETLSGEDIIKGYEYRKGQYVLVDDDDLDKINLKTTKSIGIQQFVDVSEIDPLQFDRAFYIGPDEGGERSYALLREALASTGKAGIGKVIFRSREELAAVRVVNGSLVLETLHFCNDMVKTDDMGIPSADVQVVSNELDLAKVLIDHMTTPFEPAAYKDEYDAALRDLISKKIEGEEVTAPPEPQATNVIDIVAALKASLAAAEGDGNKAETGDGAKARRAKKAA